MVKKHAAPKERIFLELIPINEDDADYLVSITRERTDDEIPLEDVLKNYGRTLERKVAAPGRKRSRRAGAQPAGERSRRSGKLG
jgi:hypothetical protein